MTGSVERTVLQELVNRYPPPPAPLDEAVPDPRKRTPRETPKRLPNGDSIVDTPEEREAFFWESYFYRLNDLFVQMDQCVRRLAAGQETPETVRNKWMEIRPQMIAIIEEGHAYAEEREMGSSENAVPYS